MGMTIARMKVGQSCIRNHALARALAYMNIIENWGSGFRKIADSCIESGLQEPEFIDMESSVRVNIYRKNVTQENEEGGLKTEKSGLKTDKVAQKTDNVAQKTDKVAQKTEKGGLKTDKVAQKTDKVAQKSDQVAQKSDQVAQKSDQVAQKTENKDDVSISLSQMEVIKALSNDPTITIQGIQTATGIPERTIKRHLSFLKSNGYIQRIGPDKGGHWEVLRNDDEI